MPGFWSKKNLFCKNTGGKKTLGSIERPEFLDALPGQTSHRALSERGRKSERKGCVITFRNVQADPVGEPFAIESDAALVGALVCQGQL